MAFVSYLLRSGATATLTRRQMYLRRFREPSNSSSSGNASGSKCVNAGNGSPADGAGAGGYPGVSGVGSNGARVGARGSAGSSGGVANRIGKKQTKGAMSLDVSGGEEAMQRSQVIGSVRGCVCVVCACVCLRRCSAFLKKVLHKQEEKMQEKKR